MRRALRTLLGSLPALFVVVVLAGATGPDVFAQQPQPAPPPQQAAPVQPPVALKQIELNDKQIQALLVAQKDMDAAADKFPGSTPDKLDPKLQAQFEDIAKKSGFASFDEYGAVYDNVSFIMTGIDPKTKAFTEPSEMLKKQIASVQGDSRIPAKDKSAILADMNTALKTMEPVKFPGNVTLVTKYYDKLGALLQDDE